jgi:hypothetical protein
MDDAPEKKEDLDEIKAQSTIFEFLGKNRAVALGFAVLIATNALLSSCAPPKRNPDTAMIQKAYEGKVEKDEAGVDDGAFYGNATGRGNQGYYHYGHLPILAGPRVTGWKTGSIHDSYPYHHSYYSHWGGIYHSSTWGNRPSGIYYGSGSHSGGGFHSSGYSGFHGGSIGG